MVFAESNLPIALNFGNVIKTVQIIKTQYKTTFRIIKYYLYFYRREYGEIKSLNHENIYIYFFFV